MAFTHFVASSMGIPSCFSIVAGGCPDFPFPTPVLLDSPSQVAGPANVARVLVDEECVDTSLLRRFGVTNRDHRVAVG